MVNGKQIIGRCSNPLGSFRVINRAAFISFRVKSSVLFHVSFPTFPLRAFDDVAGSFSRRKSLKCCCDSNPA
jgi:hypothetical protein